MSRDDGVFQYLIYSRSNNISNHISRKKIPIAIMRDGDLILPVEELGRGMPRPYILPFIGLVTVAFPSVSICVHLRMHLVS